MNTEYNKEYAVTEYVKGLTEGLKVMFGQKESEHYYFNDTTDESVNKRKELVDHVHFKAMEALKLLN